jgi:hypothetical protein
MMLSSLDSDICKYCKKPDYQAAYGPRTLLICDGCEVRAAHIQCEEQSTGKKISESVLTAGHNWYCSEVYIISFCFEFLTAQGSSRQLFSPNAFGMQGCEKVN